MKNVIATIVIAMTATVANATDWDAVGNGVGEGILAGTATAAAGCAAVGCTIIGPVTGVLAGSPLTLGAAAAGAVMGSTVAVPAAAVGVTAAIVVEEVNTSANDAGKYVANEINRVKTNTQYAREIVRQDAIMRQTLSNTMRDLNPLNWF